MPRWLAENFAEMRIDGSFQPGLSHPARTLEPLFPMELCVSWEGGHTDCKLLRRLRPLYGIHLEDSV